MSSSYLIYKIYLNRDTLYISHLPLNYIPTMVISSLPTMHRFTLNSLSPFTHTVTHTRSTRESTCRPIKMHHTILWCQHLDIIRIFFLYLILHFLLSSFKKFRTTEEYFMHFFRWWSISIKGLLLLRHMHTGFLLSVQVVYIQTKNTWLEVASNLKKKKSGSMVDAFFRLFWYPLEKLYIEI